MPSDGGPAAKLTVTASPRPPMPSAGSMAPALCYPQEIEAVIAGLDGVAQTRVVGEPHPRWGEMVVAYVVPGGGVEERALAAALPQAVGSRLARYKVPREFRMVAELPPA